jgi:hypothetical protein
MLLRGLEKLSWLFCSSAGTSGGLGAASVPSQACAQRAGGRRLGAEPDSAVRWRREGGGRRLRRLFCRLDSACSGALPGPLAWRFLARTASSLETRAQSKAGRARALVANEAGTHLRSGLRRQNQAEGNHAVDLSRRNSFNPRPECGNDGRELSS